MQQKQKCNKYNTPAELVSISLHVNQSTYSNTTANVENSTVPREKHHYNQQCASNNLFHVQKMFYGHKTNGSFTAVVRLLFALHVHWKI